MTSMIRALPLAIALAATAGSADAQFRFPKLPVIIPLKGSNSQDAPPPPVPQAGPMATPGALQGMMIQSAGSDTVYFSARGTTLDANATATLAAQARWLLGNPFVRVRLEGHGGAQDSRDYALAIGDRRANEARDFLVLQGVSPDRISVLSWGKERPGTVQVGPTVVAAGPRVVTIVQ